VADPKRVAQVREATINQFAKTHNVKVGTTMAQNPAPQKSAPSKPQTAPASNGAKPAPAAPAASASTAEEGKGEKAKKEKRPRVSLVSPKEPKFVVRMFKVDVDKFGIPKDPWGNELKVRESQPFGGGRKLSDEEKAARQAAKDAEKKRKESMSDEERIAEAKKKREEKQAAKQAKVETERADILKQLMADIAAGKIPGVKVA